jgi:hypothetical protein
MMLDALAAFVSLTTPAAQGDSPLPQRGKGPGVRAGPLTVLDALDAARSCRLQLPHGARKGGAAQGASALLPSPAARERGRG